MQVGNPETDDSYDYRGILEYAWSHSVISDREYERAKKVCDFKLINWSMECIEAMGVLFGKYREIDIYNIYAPTCLLNTSTSSPTFTTSSIYGDSLTKVSPFLLHINLFFLSLNTFSFRQVDPKIYGVYFKHSHIKRGD